MRIIARNFTKHSLRELLKDVPVLGVLVWMIETLAARTSPTWTMYRRRVRAAWWALQGREAYHGARLLLQGEDSLRMQWRVAKALGGADRALLVQIIHNWSIHNKSEGNAAETWNGYDDWAADHMGHRSKDQIGRDVRALEKMGVLKTRRRGDGNQKKVYRIDYGRLNALVAGVKIAGSDTPKTKSNPQNDAARLNNRNSKPQDDSKGKPTFLPNASTNAVTQEPPTKPAGRGGWRAGAGRKPKAKDPVTETPAADAAPNTSAESTALEAGTPAAQTPDPSPNSAAPSSHAEAALIGRMADLGLDQARVAMLIDQYGSDRVRAVVRECARRVTLGTVYSPAGWIIKELEKDIFKLGTLTAEADHAGQRVRSLSDLGSDLDEDYPGSPFAQPDPVSVDEAAIARWREALVLLEASMAAIGPAVYFNSVDESVLIGYEPGGAVYRVQTHDRDQARVCRFHVSMIREALEQVHGGPCTVEFEALEMRSATTERGRA